MVNIFFFNDTATTEIYTLSLHDALPIWPVHRRVDLPAPQPDRDLLGAAHDRQVVVVGGGVDLDRKSTRLNSSHANISYAVFCLKKKNSLRPITFFLSIYSHHPSSIFPSP